MITESVYARERPRMVAALVGDLAQIRKSKERLPIEGRTVVPLASSGLRGTICELPGSVYKSGLFVPDVTSGYARRPARYDRPNGQEKA